MLKEQESGQRTADVCRKHGISEATFYKYKAKYGGMDVSDARKLKALEDENAKLKKLLGKRDFPVLPQRWIEQAYVHYGGYGHKRGAAIGSGGGLSLCEVEG